MRQRIQKVLAAQGIGSRREIESWIAAERVTVNGKVAGPGAAIGPGDDVRLDGRRLRVRWDEGGDPEGLIYHRPAHEGLRTAVAGTDRGSIERLPRPTRGRWIAVSPMGLGEGGLELFVNDGSMAASLMSHSDRLTAGFSVRVRGDVDENRLVELQAAAAADTEAQGRIEELALMGGEAANRWVQVETAGLRPRDLKRIFEACGLEANRILRTRFGPLEMDRSLARGVSRRLTRGEMAALADAAGIVRKPPPRPGRAGGRTSPRGAPAPRSRGPTGSRKSRR
jgi:23S rRNA pseudouridine2605 synthase